MTGQVFEIDIQYSLRKDTGRTRRTLQGSAGLKCTECPTKPRTVDVFISVVVSALYDLASRHVTWQPCMAIDL